MEKISDEDLRAQLRATHEHIERLQVEIQQMREECEEIEAELERRRIIAAAADP